jgi:pyruvate carboxylase
MGDVRPDGTRTVFFELNGHPREVTVVDRSVKPTVERRPKADPNNAQHVAAPMAGKIVSVAVKNGQTVRAGERLLSIEAMKMESAVYSPRGAVVSNVVGEGEVVESGDLLLTLGP